MKYIYLFVFSLIFIAPLSAELKYQQDITLTVFDDKERAEKLAQEFIMAASGDPDIEIIKVVFKEKRLSEDCVVYDVVFTCHVAEMDSAAKVNARTFNGR